MDVLSEVLRVVKLEGALFFNAEFSAPWRLSSSRSAEMARYLAPRAEHLVIYHFVTEGRAFINVPDGKREQLDAGDIVVLPRGDAHLLGNGSHSKPLDSLRTLSETVKSGLKLARFGGGGEITRFVCGYMACDPRLSEIFLAGLPPVLKLHLYDEPAGRWLADSIRYSVVGANESSAGSGVVVAKLAEVLFVETLRRYINSLPPDQTGWLAGARDPAVGKALASLHKSPAEPWTIASLARRAGSSRSRLAERFDHFLGEPPMAYLGKWRLKLGAEMLQSSEDSVAEIAAAVGYGSEAAFNRAFKREFDSPPAQFRRARRALPAPSSDPHRGERGSSRKGRLEPRQSDKQALC